MGQLVVRGRSSADILGIDVDVSNKETKTFTDALNAKPTGIQFGMVSYGMDFLDPYNMLSVWDGGRAAQLE